MTDRQISTGHSLGDFVPEPLTYAAPPSLASAARQAVTRFTRTVVYLDAVAIGIATVATFSVRFHFAGKPHVGIAYAALISGIWLLVLANRDGYARQGLSTLKRQITVVGSSAMISFSIVAAVSYALKTQVSRGFLIAAFVASFGLICVTRFLVWRVHPGGQAFRSTAHRALVVGKEGLPDYEAVMGFSEVVSLPPTNEHSFEAWIERLIEVVQHRRIDMLLLSEGHELTQDQVRRLCWAVEGDVDVVERVALGALGRRAFLRSERSGMYIHLVEVGLTGPKLAVKRAMDLAIAFTALLILGPLMAVVWVLVKSTSNGPALFRQERVGRYGKTFVCLKFRSMKLNAHLEQSAVWEEAQIQGLGVNKHPNDPRVTGVGKVIRKLSLDELPQLLNVLRGDMSIVGPRPVQPIELRDMRDFQLRRLICKPGLTGLWQINGRSNTTWDQRMADDLTYVETWSIWTDLCIILRTVRVVLTQRGSS